MVHWTFAILLLWLGGSNLINGAGVYATAMGILFVLAILACVVLHEFGHALAAKRYGIKTPEITLLPIGGVAQLERIPEDPKQELIIALAGPMVNFVIAIALLAMLMMTGGLTQPETGLTAVGANFGLSLLLVNVILAVFNMIPAFPMDGGRVLRAFLATQMSHVKATEIAANVGQIIAIGFGIFGLFYNWFFVFVALFIYVGAQGESQMVLTRSLLKGVKVRDAMMTRFVAVAPHDPLGIVVEELLAGDQIEFPVVDSGRLLGIVRKRELFQAISDGKITAPASSVMNTDCHPVADTDLLQRTFENMKLATCETLPVFRNDRLVGLLTQSNIAEWLMVQTAKRDATEANLDLHHKVIGGGKTVHG